METDKENIYFSHLPLTGLSVGFKRFGNELFAAISLTNDGYTKDGRFKKKRKDTFSRPRARGIINGRLHAAKFGGIFTAEDGDIIAFKYTVPESLDTKKFVGAFRKAFKPFPKEKIFKDDTDKVGREFNLWDRLTGAMTPAEHKSDVIVVNSYRCMILDEKHRQAANYVALTISKTLEEAK